MNNKREIIILLLLIIFAYFCLNSCASGSGKRAFPYVRPTNNSEFILLHPENIEKPIKPEYIIADFQLCYYSAASLTNFLRGYVYTTEGVPE